MKVLISLALIAMASMAALATLLPHQQAPLVGVNSWDEPPEVSLIQLSGGDVRWVIDDQKWALKMVRLHISFVRIHGHFNSNKANIRKV